MNDALNTDSPSKDKTTNRQSNPHLQPGKVNTISKAIDINLEPVALFKALNQISPLNNAVLLESSEIESKKNVKSILMLQAAIRIECHGQQVKFVALTTNGQNALDHIAHLLKTQAILTEYDLQSVNQQTGQASALNQLIIRYPTHEGYLDEDSRLKQANAIDALRTVQNAFKSAIANEYSVFLTGLFAFDFIANFERLPELSEQADDCPDYVFYLAESLLVFDHRLNQNRLFSNHFSGKDGEKTYFEMSRSFENIEQKIHQLKLDKPFCLSASSSQLDFSSVNVDIPNAEYEKTVEALKQHIIQGDIFQVVPSRTFSLSCHSPINSYLTLKHTNPSPYMFYMQDQDFILFGASPESSLKFCHETRSVELYPIAGTRPRGRLTDHEIDLDLDARIEAELKLDQKEVSEHMMLVDLARNDIARIAESGTTYVPRLLEVDRYSQVMHLVSCVRGTLRSDLDALHAYQACMNMGTLTGAPKIKATQLIRQVEGKRRGSYGGAVGYLNGRGDMDSCIVIRSAFYKNGTAYIQAGAGIVYDSVPASEAKETENKAAAVIRAILLANQQASL
ncbi:anthranilate synthase component 1 [Aliikangiella maris]|uniref:Anthranilate synthase component 1 n=2 Tax=Aliikangiella maris TaxID=3162458 RepID=A0ABV2BVK0_9GAMM